MNKFLVASIAIAFVGLLTAYFLYQKAPEQQKLRVFYAAGFAQYIDSITQDAERELNIKLLAEGSGSQVACRKLTELGRPCDLLILADNVLVATLLKGYADWRLDFASDEIVLAIGSRAKYTEQAEDDWQAVLQRPDVRVARVDENQGPIGYRSMIVWKLAEKIGSQGIFDTLRKKCEPVVDDVARLIPLLKTGEIDYAFSYRSTCIAADIRYIELDPRISLGSPMQDYSDAEISFDALKAGSREVITRKGELIAWTATIPNRNASAELAMRFVEFMFTRKAREIELCGFRLIRPIRFFGDKSHFSVNLFDTLFPDIIVAGAL